MQYSHNLRRWRHSIATCAVALSVCTGGLFLAASPAQATSPNTIKNWTHWGNGLDNNHHIKHSGISKNNVNKVIELCKIDYLNGAVPAALANPATKSASSKPVIIGDMVYWTAFGGRIGAHKVLRDSEGNFTGCEEVWRKDVSTLLGLVTPDTEPATRNSPGYYKRKGGKGTLVYTAYASIFTLPSPFTTQPVAYAVDADSGDLLWKIPLASTADVMPTFMGGNGRAFAPSTTGSPRVYKGVAYVGISSLNNSLPNPPFALTFQGHMIALDLGVNTGVPSIKWTQYTLPPRPASYAPGTWFSGGGVWASSPSIIPEKNLVIFGSGQLYQYPDFVANCMSQNAPVNTPEFSTTLKGETGGGAQACLEEAEAKLKNDFGIYHPIATNSVIALNMNDGSFAWHVPTNGIDSWQADCGVNINAPCNVPVVGPDWDISGNAPVVVRLKDPKQGLSKRMVISHNKGGALYWINADNGHVLRRADICVGSAVGGIHWGFSYDPNTETLLVPCAAGGELPPAYGGAINFQSILADGRHTCRTGYLNGIDVRTGQLKWQTLPASSEITVAGGSSCPGAVTKYSIDERFKYGVPFDIVLKNKTFPGVPVNEMPNSPQIPLAGQNKAFSNGIPSNGEGVVYWPVYYGAIYALDINNGQFLHQMFCDQGSEYIGASTANGLVSFGCGYGNFGPNDGGQSIMIYGLEKFKGYGNN